MAQSVRVLHVDDEPDFAELAATFLEQLDNRITVETATRADDGLELLDESVDCVVSDYDMPERNGLQFLKAVRDSYPDLPFILFTGKGSEEVASDAISAGVTDYLQKESGTHQYRILANRVKNAVERDRFEQEADRVHTQLEAISENSADAIVIIDENSRIRFANPTVEEYFGYEPFELIDQPLTTIMPEQHRQPHLRAIDRYLETGEKTLSWSNVEFHGLHKDGTEVPLSVSYGEFHQDGERRFIGIMREISDRTELEENLREREEQFRQMAENIQEVVWMSTPDADEILYVNPAYEDIWGRPVENLYEDPSTFIDAIHPDDRKRVQQAIARQTVGEYDEVYRITRPDGEVRWIRDRAIPIENDMGEIYRIVGIASDITERKQREQELRQKQAELRKYELTVENSIDLLAACDTDYDLLFANEQYQLYHGIDTSDISTESLPELLGKEWDNTVKAHVDRVLSSALVQYEMERPGPDGDMRNLDIRYYPLRQDDGTVIGVVAAMRDRTQLKAEKQEREQIISRVTDAIIEVDSNWRFTLVNDQAEELCDMSETYLLGRDFWEVFSEAQGTRFEEEYRLAMKTREPTTFVEYFSQLDGWFDINVYPKQDGGIAFYFVDVSEQRKRERYLEQQNERLEAFTNVVSHDLKNPLSVAEGRLELAMEDCDSQHLTAVREAHSRMETLIDDLRFLASEGGQLSEPEPVELSGILASCWAQVETKEAVLRTDIDGTVQADKSRFKQVFENHIRNAIEHGGDDVTITVDNLEDGFFVEDDGPGIPAEDRTVVFDEGYSTKEGGTGFGLSIVKVIVEAHGWEICVTAGTDGGARFEITGVNFV